MQRQPEPEWMDVPEEAEAYAEADFAQVNAAFVDRLAQLGGEYDRPVTVDLGTGPGDIPVLVAKALPTWRVIAFDVSHAMLVLARGAVVRAGMAGNIGLVEADAKRLPLASGAVDVVFSNSILHHITDNERLWREIRRITKPGGLIFVRDLARPADERTARTIVDQYAGTESALLQEEFYRSLLAAYTVEEVRGQLDRTGLGPLRVERVTDRHLDVWGRFVPQTRSVSLSS